MIKKVRDDVMESELKELQALDEQIDHIKNARADLMIRMAEQYSPVKKGDYVSCQGWSHRGKMIEVTLVSLVHGRSFADVKYEWLVKGLIVRKNGSTGLNIADFRMSLSGP